MKELLAPAKLTWFLEVTGVREDGYHTLRSEMVSLDFSDRLIIEESDDYLRLTPASIRVPLDETNLISKALNLVGRKAGVTIDKVIPTGGGLGGGSSDAGAILRWVGGVGAELAATLGGDVPFCQLGGRAMVEGIGEVLTPLQFEKRDVTLIIPNFSVDTKACYQAFDELGEVGEGRNHLERAARIVEPRLHKTMNWLSAELGKEVHLAGSGSTMFVEGHLEPGQSVWDVQGPAGTLRFRQTSTTPQEA